MAHEANKYVLLIEDNPGDAFLVQEYLHENPEDRLKVVWVKCLTEALELPAKDEIDVVLTDLSLPDSMGLDTVRAVVAAFPTKPIIVLTGLSDTTIGVRAVHEGCQDYVVKGSGDGETLRLAIRYAIERKSIERRLRESEEKLR